MDRNHWGNTFIFYCLLYNERKKKLIPLIDRLTWFESKMENKAVFDNPLYHLGTVLCILLLIPCWLIDTRCGTKSV